MTLKLIEKKAQKYERCNMELMSQKKQIREGVDQQKECNIQGRSGVLPTECMSNYKCCGEGNQGEVRVIVQELSKDNNGVLLDDDVERLEDNGE